MKRKSAIERFWSRVDKLSDPNGCWVWIGYRHNGTHGRRGIISIKGKDIYVHRFSWEIHNGEIPKDMCVCHRCDNPICVNPDHLFLGTHQDNVRDMVQKGRSARGSKNSHSILTEE